MIYSCSSRPMRWQWGGMRASSKSRGSLVRNLAKLPKKETSRPLPFFELVNVAQSSTRFQGLAFRNLIKTPRAEILWRVSFKLVSTAQKGLSFNSGSYSRIRAGVLIKSFASTKDIYRFFEVYQVLTFVGYGKKLAVTIKDSRCLNFSGYGRRWNVLIGNLNVPNQDKNYFFLSKLDLEGLIGSEDNSAKEIVAALLLHWQQGKLESRKINVVFYRSLKFQLDSGRWVETQSFLINAHLDSSVNRFPSPQSFLF